MEGHEFEIFIVKVHVRNHFLLGIFPWQLWLFIVMVSAVDNVYTSDVAVKQMQSWQGGELLYVYCAPSSLKYDIMMCTANRYMAH